MSDIKVKWATEWSTLNPILRKGEPGLDWTSGRLKIGDGKTRWNDLLFLTDLQGASYTLPSYLSQETLKSTFTPADPVLSDFVYDAATGNLTSYKEDDVLVSLTYNVDGTVATTKRGSGPTRAYSYSGGNLAGVA